MTYSPHDRGHIPTRQMLEYNRLAQHSPSDYCMAYRYGLRRKFLNGSTEVEFGSEEEDAHYRELDATGYWDGRTGNPPKRKALT